MKTGNRVSKPGWVGTLKSVSLGYLRPLPSIPRLPSLRDKIADCIIVVLVFLARASFLLGPIVGGFYGGAKGFMIGLGTGGIAGFWIRHSAGLRGRDSTHGFFVRMGERGLGSSFGLLEWVIEKVRGCELAPVQCRLLASAYAEFQRSLQSCHLAEERDALYKELERSMHIAFYGKIRLSPPANSNNRALSAEAVGTEV
jgi:hypothetical protein